MSLTLADVDRIRAAIDRMQGWQMLHIVVPSEDAAQRLALKPGSYSVNPEMPHHMYKIEWAR